MKKKLLTIFTIFAVVAAGAAAVTKVTGNLNRQHDKSELTIVTSFYPMYILTSNLAKDIPGVSVANLTENQTGCLHDYQLTTQDMIELNAADLLVMNGGGMESFIEGVLKSYPHLEVVEASQGIPMLKNESEHDHEHEEEHEEEHDHHHDHGEYNAHVWMNVDDYLMQMKNVYQALVEKDPEHSELYEKNYQEYQGKVEVVKKEYEEQLTDIVNKEVVIFHDAFAYLAEKLSLDVIYTINLDGETTLSAGEVKEIIDEVNLHSVKALFTEEQYSDSIAKSVAKETNASVYVIDSLVTGSNDLDSYIKGMRHNLNVLKQALY